MKQIISFSFLIFLFVLNGCGSSETTINTTENDKDRSVDIVRDDKNFHKDLAGYLQLVPGVQILGTESTRQVMIRGVSSFSLNTEPLFVLDGQVVGNMYSQVHNLINVYDIDNVRVLKGTDASIYGVRGSNGVIVITTKK
jgi:TonB-dependent SusC/RagA subfamily outer membrane receptor